MTASSPPHHDPAAADLEPDDPARDHVVADEGHHRWEDVRLEGSLRRALRSASLRIPDSPVESLGTVGGAAVYGIGELALVIDDSADTDAEVSRRLGALVELHDQGVPLARPARPVPLRSGDLRVVAYERLYDQGPVDIEALGATVRRLHQAPLFCLEGLDAHWDPLWATPVLVDHEAQLGTDTLDVLLEALESGAMVATSPERCCHGNLTMGSVMWDATGPKLVGWEHVGRAAILSDLATLSASMVDDAGSPDELAHWHDAFAAGYGAPLPDPGTVELVLAVRLAERTARTLVAGGDPAAFVRRVLDGAPRWSQRIR